MPCAVDLHSLAVSSEGYTLINVKPSAPLKTPPIFPFDFTLKSLFDAAWNFFAPGHSNTSVQAWFPIQLLKIRITSY